MIRFTILISIWHSGSRRLTRRRALRLGPRLKTASGRLVIDYMQAVGDNAREDISDLMRFSYRAALEKYSTDTGVVLRLHNRIVTALVDKIFPGKKGDEIYIARRVNNA